MLGSIGILIPNMECKVISEDNKGNCYFIIYDKVKTIKLKIKKFNLLIELGYNESGEFCFRGPNIMKVIFYSLKSIKQN